MREAVRLLWKLPRRDCYGRVKRVHRVSDLADGRLGSHAVGLLVPGRCADIDVYSYHGTALKIFT